ncbi:galactose-1-phosphate uridyl transferase [Cystobasidiomycetes sp. EMM_F5]
MTKLEKYDPKCYLCPGNKRAGNASNPKYESTYRFENDFAAVREIEIDFPKSTAPSGVDPASAVSSLYRSEPARGKCFVICFSPRHDLTIAQLKQEEMLQVVGAWQSLYTEITSDLPWIQYIQIFENKGSMMGCSNPHPHGQAWSLSYIPGEAGKELKAQKQYSDSNNGAILLLEYAQAEIQSKSPRIVIQSEHFAALTPYWALWPFEVIVCPTKRHIPHIAALSEQEKQDFADVLRRLACRYDNREPKSYSQTKKPTLHDTEYATAVQLHVAFAPPLLRSASVRKFLVGSVLDFSGLRRPGLTLLFSLFSFELFGEPQRDLTAEQAAAKLQACSEEHYKQRD